MRTALYVVVARRVKSDRGRDAGGAGQRPSPAIQTWPTREAPESLRSVIGADAGYDWVALVPAELNAPDVVGLLLRNSVVSPVQTHELADGGLLLAGHFDTSHSLPFAQIPQVHSKARKARSAGH